MQVILAINSKITQKSNFFSGGTEVSLLGGGGNLQLRMWSASASQLKDGVRGWVGNLCPPLKSLRECNLFRSIDGAGGAEATPAWIYQRDKDWIVGLTRSSRISEEIIPGGLYANLRGLSLGFDLAGAGISRVLEPMCSLMSAEVRNLLLCWKRSG